MQDCARSFLNGHLVLNHLQCTKISVRFGSGKSRYGEALAQQSVPQRREQPLYKDPSTFLESVWGMIYGFSPTFSNSVWNHRDDNTCV